MLSKMRGICDGVGRERVSLLGADWDRGFWFDRITMNGRASDVWCAEDGRV